VTATVEVAGASSPELLEGLNNLLPQLSSTARPFTSADLEALLANETVSLLVASDAGRVVGTLTLVIFPLPTGMRAWIEDVVVDETARGTGVGEALCTHAFGLARARGAKTLDLTSRPSREAANALYLRLGFAVRETNVYRFSLETLNADESR
jgi:ribosomal protein S18 acetylase RimI-like enzyme